MALNHFRANHFAARHFAVLRRATDQVIIGGGVGRGGGVSRRELKRTTEELLNLLFSEQIPQKIVENVRKAVQKTVEMSNSDELETTAAQSARDAVEQAWQSVQAEKVQLETQYALQSIQWLLTLQQELSILYAFIDDEEAAIVLLLST